MIGALCAGLMISDPALAWQGESDVYAPELPQHDEAMSAGYYIVVAILGIALLGLRRMRRLRHETTTQE